MKKNVLVSLIALILFVLIFPMPENLFAFSAGRTSSGLVQDDFFGDYFLFSERRSVSLDLEEARLVSVLKLLSQQTGLNFVSTEAVRGRRITAYLDEVPFKKAVEVLFKANNLTYEYYPDAKMFVVKELGEPQPERETRVYHLNYARVGSSRMQSEIDAILAEGGAGAERGAGTRGGATCIESIITSIVEGQGRVVGNSNTNSLIVTASPSLFPHIEQVIDSLDTPPLKVMIEVEVLDVSKDAVDRLGFRHEGGEVGSGLSARIRPYFEGHRLTDFGSFSGASILETDYRITAELLRRDTTAKLLARPRILTLNNETAEINVVSDEVIGTEIERDRDDGTTTITVERVSDIGDYRGAGVSLRVTPQVNPVTKEITMVIHPSVVSTSPSTFADAHGNLFRNVDDRSTRSVARLTEGETLLLGGLIEKQEGQASSRVPFFADIPFLGSFFRNRAADTNDRELMIFLTPRIVADRVHLGREVSSSLRREQKDLSRQKSIGKTLDNLIVR